MTDIHPSYTNSIIALKSGLWTCFREEEHPHRLIWRLENEDEGGEVYAEPDDYCGDGSYFREALETLTDCEKVEYVRKLRIEIFNSVSSNITNQAVFDLLNAPTKTKAEVLASVLSLRAQAKMEG